MLLLLLARRFHTRCRWRTCVLMCCTAGEGMQILGISMGLLASNCQVIRGWLRHYMMPLGYDLMRVCIIQVGRTGWMD